MLTFFRRTRKGLLDMGAARKYILYAVGEVLLVMVGILLALQVNNWNEWRKDRIKEKEVLLNLELSLQTNIDLITDFIENTEEWSMSSDVIISALENGANYNDSFAGHFHNARVRGAIYFVFNRAGYEAYKDAGFGLVNDKLLKNEILNLFEVIYPSIQKILNWVEVQSLNEDQNNYYLGNFDIDSDNGMIPIDYQSLLNDHFFISLLKTIRNQRSWMYDEQLKCLKDTKKVLQLIKDELGE